MLEDIPLLGQRNQSFVDSGERLTRKNFKEGTILGSGSFAKVRKVISLSTGRSYAMKALSLKQLRQLKLTEQLRNELGILAKCQHENIITLFGAFAEEDQVFLVLELADGSLFDKLVKTFPLSEERVAGYMADIIRAVSYLHAVTPPVLHRDLKPENVLIINGRCKIADFGWSNTDNAYRNTYCGTFDYLAPEMILGTGHNEKLDVWTLGVLMYELMEGRPPFSPKEKIIDKRLASKITEKNILSGNLTFNRKLSAEAMAAIRHIVNVDESRRPAARDILDLEFFRKHIGAPQARSRSHAPALTSSRALPPPDTARGGRTAELRAKAEALEAKNKEMARLVEEKSRSGELSAVLARNADKEKELADIRERIAAWEKKGQERSRFSKSTNQGLLGVSHELNLANDTLNQLTGVSRELVEMIYAFNKKPVPANLTFDRSALAAAQRELQTALAPRVDMRRGQEQPTKFVFDNGQYRIVSRSRSRERQHQMAPYGYLPSSGQTPPKVELLQSFAYPPSETPPKLIYYSQNHAMPYASR